mmetsp:Transcript_88141/g.273945  ORF Transcript_88141/g.273945 Transcript_88141/m.273945 type:complete len:158 (-) Transcript_88141:90-563(-)
MQTRVLLDADRRPGFISTILRFGPNAVNGTINETGIVGYSVFLLDSCGRRSGAPVASVAAQPQAPVQPCCQHDTYTVQFTAPLPIGYAGAALTVIPQTTAGLLPIGLVSEFVTDDTSAGAGLVAVGRIGHGTRRHGGAGGVVLVMAVFVGGFHLGPA